MLRKDAGKPTDILTTNPWISAGALDGMLLDVDSRAARLLHIGHQPFGLSVKSGQTRPVRTLLRLHQTAMNGSDRKVVSSHRVIQGELEPPKTTKSDHDLDLRIHC